MSVFQSALQFFECLLREILTKRYEGWESSTFQYLLNYLTPHPTPPTPNSAACPEFIKNTDTLALKSLKEMYYGTKNE